MKALMKPAVLALSAALAAAVLTAGAPAFAERGGHDSGPPPPGWGGQPDPWSKDPWKKNGWKKPHCPPGLYWHDDRCERPGPPPPKPPKHRHDHDHDNGARYRPGDHLPWDYRILDQPWRYGLPRGTYGVYDGYVYRIDGGSARILQLLGLLSDLRD